jgi:hypothetical protein
MPDGSTKKNWEKQRTLGKRETEKITRGIVGFRLEHQQGNSYFP